jgi:hypothetical protein
LEAVRAMAIEDFNSAYTAITALEGQETIVQMKVAQYPQMMPNDREKFYRAVNKMAFPNQVPKAISIEEMARLVNG